ncbi:MAG: hypothetical protein U1E26_04380 [Coriobacteriia bacterium]|nr:hypothetical protein [Coriobacteriia bacterium]
MTGDEARRLRIEPLWRRVDANRTKIAVFVVLFILGSAVLLEFAMIVVPGTLLSLLASDTEVYFSRLAIVVASTFGLLLASGALLAAIQLSNAEDWVRARFKGRDFAPGEAPALEMAVADMALAAGLAEPPRIVLLEGPADGVNALALGTTRSKPLIGVTPGFLSAMSPDEQRAVVATLTARILAGDIMFGTALAALMGPIKAIRGFNRAAGGVAGAAADAGCANGGCVDTGCVNSGCGDTSCTGCIDLDDADAGGCFGIIGIVLFLAVVAAITYVAVLTAAWIVTLWGRVLHRTAYEKADAEGMLLLKDPSPMLTALSKASRTSNATVEGDSSYDGIFYVGTSGTPRIEKAERRRYDRLREVLGTEGIAAAKLE